MILQSLARYYDILVQDPKTDIAPRNYSATGVRFALVLSDSGELLNLTYLFDQIERRGKLEEGLKAMFVPEQLKRAGKNPPPNFLCDNAAYVLGSSNKDDTQPAYSASRFSAFREFHLKLLGHIDCAPARAVCAFLRTYDPITGRDHPEISRNLELLLENRNLVFQVNGRYVHDDPAIRAVWKAHVAASAAGYAQCLVTGEEAPIERLHASLKGVRGANSMGATLVGYNAKAYESYNRTQGMNAPVSKRATFAYTTALNHLLSRGNENPAIALGDTTVVYWAESDDKTYRDVFMGLVDPAYVAVDETPMLGRDEDAERRLKMVSGKVKRGQPLDADSLMEELDPTTRFYVLGLAPNAARISVRFFHADLFANIIERIMRHYEDLSMVKEFENQKTYLTVRDVVGETMSKKASKPRPSPLLAGAIFRAILTGVPYPAGLYSAILTRVRADQDDKKKYVSKIGYERAAIIKACLLRKYRNQPNHIFQEVLTMPLNVQSRQPAYLLGRLFAVLEKAQQDAIPSLTATIKDRYFTTACASPRSVFPILLRLSQHHIAKAEYGYVSDRRIQDIVDLLDVESNPIPARLNLDEQGVFILGYYHQRVALYQKRDVGDAAEPQSTDH